MKKNQTQKAQHVIPIKSNKAHSKKIAKREIKKSKQIKPISKKSLVNYNPSQIKCKEKRVEIFFRRKKEMSKLKKQKRKQNKEVAEEDKKLPLTIDDKKEIDENFIFDYNQNNELQKEEEIDEFMEFFKGFRSPKIMMTTSERPTRQMYDFLKEMKDVFSEAHYWPRKQFSIKEIQLFAIQKEYSDLLIFREDRKEVNELIMIHLPNGPTMHFKVSNIILSDKIHHSGRVTDHNPEIILNNFNSKIGRRIGRFFSSLFPQNPDFKGRRVVTFHNQRDFIFFRHHRYMFQDEGQKVALQEIGPRFTLALKKIQLGLFDNQTGEIEFEMTDNLHVSRTRIYI